MLEGIEQRDSEGERGPLEDGVAHRNEEREEYWRLVEMEVNCDYGGCEDYYRL